MSRPGRGSTMSSWPKRSLASFEHTPLATFWWQNTVQRMAPERTGAPRQVSSTHGTPTWMGWVCCSPRFWRDCERLHSFQSGSAVESKASVIPLLWQSAMQVDSFLCLGHLRLLVSTPLYTLNLAPEMVCHASGGFKHGTTALGVLEIAGLGIGQFGRWVESWDPSGEFRRLFLPDDGTASRTTPGNRNKALFSEIRTLKQILSRVVS